MCVCIIIHIYIYIYTYIYIGSTRFLGVPVYLFVMCVDVRSCLQTEWFGRVINGAATKRLKAILEASKKNIYCGGKVCMYV